MAMQTWFTGLPAVPDTRASSGCSARQVIVGSYIVDFFASAVRLIVEVDGGCTRMHAETRGSIASATACCS
jgi:very-short-patch-repair endonuclease